MIWSRGTELELISGARSRVKSGSRDSSRDITILVFYLDQSNKLEMNFGTRPIPQVLVPADLPNSRLKL